jgi:iron complex transport system permease protein
MLADLLARTLIAPQQLPAGALIALIGAPLFLALLYREGKS